MFRTNFKPSPVKNKRSAKLNVHKQRIGEMIRFNFRNINMETNITKKKYLEYSSRM